MLFFDINMIPCIDNDKGIASVRKYLDEKECKNVPTDFVLEAFEL